MTPSDLLQVVGAVLSEMGCEYFATGSVAATAYGDPRMTNDVDIVVRINPTQARELADRFSGEEWYVSTEAADAAARHPGAGQFNIIHVPSGLKADIMVARDDAFNRSRFSRVRFLRLSDEQPTPFASPEDVILKKLVYFQEGQSQKHIRDIRGILRLQGAQAIDLEYLRRWASALGIRSELESCLADSGS